MTWPRPALARTLGTPLLSGPPSCGRPGLKDRTVTESDWGEGGCGFLLSPKAGAQNSLRQGRAEGPGGRGRKVSALGPGGREEREVTAPIWSP